MAVDFKYCDKTSDELKTYGCPSILLKNDKEFQGLVDKDVLDKAFLTELIEIPKEKIT